MHVTGDGFAGEGRVVVTLYAVMLIGCVRYVHRKTEVPG